MKTRIASALMLSFVLTVVGAFLTMAQAAPREVAFLHRGLKAPATSTLLPATPVPLPIAPHERYTRPITVLCTRFCANQTARLWTLVS